MHVLGADLHLDAMTLRAKDAGMQGAIAVGLGRRDVVLEAVGHHGVMAVNDAQGPIAIFDRIDHDPEGHDVGELLESDVLHLHLAPDGEGSLFPARHLGLDAVFLQDRAQLGQNAVD